jgi:hypothetical protein
MAPVGIITSSAARFLFMSLVPVVRRIIEFVLHDDQFKQLGLRGGAAVAFREIYVREPTKQEVDQAVRDFWQAWHERFDNPRSPPSGAGSPYYTLEELSPWQENAIRALEEREDPSYDDI